MKISILAAILLAVLVLWLLSCESVTESKPSARTKGLEPLVCSMTWNFWLQDSVLYCPDPQPPGPPW